ncbi:SsgA family sporulation/cell division regulator [Streptomyces althioticus]|uniref:SsgA family sporulation/cell division regulator n=1 Tax=Streptomyces althioticus TaxID=83380 RepID=UPI0033EDDFFF
MIIECELLGQPRVIFLDSDWAYDPRDPLAVEVKFGSEGPTWTFSLDLLMDAFTAPETGLLHGSGDFLVEVWENFTIVHLSNGVQTASLQFSTADIESFLVGIDVPSPDEIIALKLNEFLETL